VRIFPKSNITERSVQVLQAALPSYSIVLGKSAISRTNSADVLFVNRDLVNKTEVMKVATALNKMGVSIKSIQQSSIGGRREIQVGTIADGETAINVFEDYQPLDLSQLQTLNGAAFWREAFNGRVYCQQGIGYTTECQMSSDGRPVH
jgi:hypothetical protein